MAELQLNCGLRGVQRVAAMEVLRVCHAVTHEQRADRLATNWLFGPLVAYSLALLPVRQQGCQVCPAGWEQMRNFYGLPTEQFHQFVAAWHASGLYIMAAAAAGWVCIFNVGSAKVEDKVKAHDKNCRNLCYDAANNTLLTCSFDRSVKVFER